MALVLSSTLCLYSYAPTSAELSINSITSYLSSPRNNDRNPPRWQCNASKKPSFVNQILDYIEGGPKLRKWYGAPELLPKDGSVGQEKDDPDVEEARDAVLVTDGDSDIGQMVILSLIIKRAKVKALVKDRRRAMEAFGTYVESLTGDVNDKAVMKKALKGVRAVICPNEGFISKAGSLGRAQHVVYLSQLSVYKGADGIQALMRSNARKLAEQDEYSLMALGVPYTIIRAGSLLNTPGGTQGFSFQEGIAATGSLSKEDAAFICVEALESVPDTGLIIEVVNGEEKVSDWKQQFTQLKAKQGNTQG